MDIAEKLKRPVEVLADDAELDIELGRDPLNLLALAGDAGSFLVVELIGDPVGVVSTQELALLLIEALQDTLTAAALRLAAGAHALRFGLNDLAEPVLPFR